MTAAELLQTLARDPGWVAANASRESTRAELEAFFAHAERPIVEDLRSVGVEVDSVWDLVASDDPYPAALPVLLAHLEEGGYPDRIMEGLGRALAVGPSGVFW